MPWTGREPGPRYLCFCLNWKDWSAGNQGSKWHGETGCSDLLGGAGVLPESVSIRKFEFIDTIFLKSLPISFLKSVSLFHRPVRLEQLECVNALLEKYSWASKALFGGLGVFFFLFFFCKGRVCSVTELWIMCKGTTRNRSCLFVNVSIFLVLYFRPAMGNHKENKSKHWVCLEKEKMYHALGTGSPKQQGAVWDKVLLPGDCNHETEMLISWDTCEMMKKDISVSVLCQKHKKTVILEKLNTTMQILTAVNPAQVQVVTGWFKV